MSSAQVETAPSSSMAVPPPPPPPPAVMKKNQQPLPAPSSGSNRQSPPTAGRQRSSSLSAAPPSSSSVSPTSSSSSVPTKSISSSSLGSETSSLPPLVPHYTKPAILGLPPSAVLTKQEMDFRANLLNPNNDLFWTARGLIRPPVLADALAQGHAILKHEGHLTQKQGGRRLSAQYGRSGGNGPSASLTSSAPSASQQLPLGFGASVVNPTSVTAAVQSSWRSAAPTAAPAPPLPSHVTKEEMDFRANRLNPNNDVFWTARGLIRPPVLADALAQGHAILQQEGHLTQTQSHKGRGRLNSLPQSSLYASADSRASAEPRRSVSGQGLPGSSSGASSSGGRSSSWRSAGERERESQPMAMRRRASTTGSMMMNRPPALDGSVTKEEVDLRANLMNPNNSIFWTSRGLTRPADLQEALAKGHAVLEAEGHVTHNPAGGSGAAAGGGRSRSWNRRGSRTELHGPPAVSPLVAAAQRQWSTPFLAPNAGAGPLGAPPSTLTARSGGLPGAAWVHASGGSGPVPSTSRHPDWQASSNIAAQRRRYSLPPPGFELFTPPAHFGLFRPPLQAKQAAGVAAMPIVREGAADGEWDKMDAEAAAAAAARPPHSAAIPIIKPTAADLAKNKAESSSWRKAAPSVPKAASSADEEAKAMKQEDKKTTTATATSSTAAAATAPSLNSKLSTSSGTSPTRMSPSEPTTPGSEKLASPSIDKVGSLAWQLTQVKLRTRRPSEARESEHVTKSATA